MGSMNSNMRMNSNMGSKNSGSMNSGSRNSNRP
jgi:hypothetical protein